MKKVGIYGATGYTGAELVKLLTRHPQAELTFATSETHAGEILSTVIHDAPNISLQPAAAAPLDTVELVFLCLPHSTAALSAIAALETGTRVIDLSADFRLRDAEQYKNWYGYHHPAPDLLREAVYGLTETARPEIAGARLVANPGCYPTSVLLPIWPLLAAGVMNCNRPMIVDSKSGVSGSGRTPQQHLHFVEVANNFSPYKIGRVHRHLPEMEQEITRVTDNPPELIFSPHLLPVPRGILSTIYLPLLHSADHSAVRKTCEQAYAGEPFVSLVPAGHNVTLAHVLHTNRCVFGLTFSGDTLIITSALDNLVKGAAGQAVQNMNVVFGWEESTGLT